MVLALAVKANYTYIVTYNKQDFTGLDTFGIKTVDLCEFLKIIGEIPCVL